MKIKHKKEATIIFMVASGLGRVSFLFYYVVIRALNKGNNIITWLFFQETEIESMEDFSLNENGELYIKWNINSNYAKLQFNELIASNKGSELPKPKGVGLPGQSA